MGMRAIDLEALKRGQGVQLQEAPPSVQLLRVISQQLSVQNVMLEAIMRVLMGQAADEVLDQLHIMAPGLNAPLQDAPLVEGTPEGPAAASDPTAI